MYSRVQTGGQDVVTRWNTRGLHSGAAGRLLVHEHPSTNPLPRTWQGRQVDHCEFTTSLVYRSELQASQGYKWDLSPPKKKKKSKRKTERRKGEMQGGERNKWHWPGPELSGWALTCYYMQGPWLNSSAAKGEGQRAATGSSLSSPWSYELLTKKPRWSRKAPQTISPIFLLQKC